MHLACRIQLKEFSAVFCKLCDLMVNVMGKLNTIGLFVLGIEKAGSDTVSSVGTAVCMVASGSYSGFIS